MSSLCPPHPKVLRPRQARRPAPSASSPRLDADSLVGIACVLVLVVTVLSFW